MLTNDRIYYVSLLNYLELNHSKHHKEQKFLFRVWSFIELALLYDIETFEIIRGIFV